MKTPLTRRLHEWAADSVDSVQYLVPIQLRPPRHIFRYQMPWYQRVFIAASSLVMIVVAAPAGRAAVWCLLLVWWWRRQFDFTSINAHAL